MGEKQPLKFIDSGYKEEYQRPGTDKLHYLKGNGSAPAERKPRTLLEQLNEQYLDLNSTEVPTCDPRVAVQEQLRGMISEIRGGLANEEKTG